MRVEVWNLQGAKFTGETARIDADGSMVPTAGECKEGMDISHKGIWGYHPLLVSLANTHEPLFIINRSGNRPSHEGAPIVLDQAIELCRRAGFRDVLLRGDTDFTMAAHLDRWTAAGVRFVFGYDANPSFVNCAENLGDGEYSELVRKADEVFTGRPRTQPPRIKEDPRARILQPAARVGRRCGVRTPAVQGEADLSNRRSAQTHRGGARSAEPRHHLPVLLLRHQRLEALAGTGCRGIQRPVQSGELD
jgi:hypothetical protein